LTNLFFLNILFYPVLYLFEIRKGRVTSSLCLSLSLFLFFISMYIIILFYHFFKNLYYYFSFYSIFFFIFCTFYVFCNLCFLYSIILFVFIMFMFSFCSYRYSLFVYSLRICPKITIINIIYFIYLSISLFEDYSKEIYKEQFFRTLMSVIINSCRLATIAHDLNAWK